MLKIYRCWHDVNIRDGAADIGISASTLSRIENGEKMDGETLAKIIKWLLE